MIFVVVIDIFFVLFLIKDIWGSVLLSVIVFINKCVGCIDNLLIVCCMVIWVVL